MKIKYNPIIIFALIVMISCNESKLEIEPRSEYSDFVAWNDPKIADVILNGIYMRMNWSFANNQGITNLVDESHERDVVPMVEFNRSNLSADLIPGWTQLPTWQNQYSYIRSCNQFIENVENLPDEGTELDGVTKKNSMKGEAHFLRAYFYMNLISLFGGVPIITQTYQLNDDFSVARDTFEDCINFIVDECDKAADLLPLERSGSDRGRATKGAAMALKSRILLYAASDLYNTTVFPGYTNPELVGYTEGDRMARWQRAKDAAKAIMDLGIYSLFRANPAPTDSVTLNIIDLFLSYSNEEEIFTRYFTPTSFSPNVNWMNLSGPNGYHCRGSNTPSDNLVRDYELKDGTKFDWNNPDHAAEPYKNRDPRFYATIFHEGAKWRQRAPGEYPLDPEGRIQVGVWQRWDSEKNEMYEQWGLDTRKGPNSPFEGGYTGYYVRKWFDPEVDAQFEVPDIPWRYFRYGEILLNYAEACIGLGQDAEARTYINMIRKRAGMPDVTESGEALRERYRNERRIELAIEDHRFFDVRRWVIGPKAYVAAYKVNVVYELLPDKTTATVPTITPAVHVSYAWDDKAYFLPILRSELNRNQELKQNPGYE